MARRRFVLLKDTPELKVGAIVEEQCDDGNQGFYCVNVEEFKAMDDEYNVHYTRKTILNRPEWFEELVTMTLTKKEAEKLKKILGE